MTKRKFQNYRIALIMLNHELNQLPLCGHQKKREKLYQAKNKLWAKIEKSINFEEEK